MKTNYTVERYTSFDDKLWDFLADELPKLSSLYGDTFNYNQAHFNYLMEKCHFLVGKQNGHITGIMIASMTRSPFDYTKVIFQQVLMYVKPESCRMAYHLFNEFVDIGKKEANHIIVTLGKHTNIKPSSLERYGFNYLESSYKMEVIR